MGANEVLSLNLSKYLSDAPRNDEGGHVTLLEMPREVMRRSSARWGIMSLKWPREVLSLILVKYLSDAPRNVEGGQVMLLDTSGAYEPQVAEGGP